MTQFPLMKALDNSPSRKIQVYPWKRIWASGANGGWPVPKKHQYCQFIQREAIVDVKGNTSYNVLATNLIALDAIRQRPDINCLEIELCDLLWNNLWAQRIEELLNTNDRSWSIVLRWSCEDSPFDPSRLKRAFSSLGNVEYLYLGHHQLSEERKCDVFRSLPHFQKLKCLNLQRWICSPEHVEILFQSCVASKLAGIRLNANDLEQGFSLPLFSNQIATRIHTLDLHLGFSSVHTALQLVEAVVELPCLTKLLVHLGGGCPRHIMKPISNLFQWLESPNCPVTDLAFVSIPQDLLPSILATLPNVPKLQAIQLDVYDLILNLNSLFSVLQEMPNVEWVTLRSRKDSFDEQDFCNILNFQRHGHHRRRRFCLQRSRDAQPLRGPGPEAIHHVSLMYQTEQHFEHFTTQSRSFPLSARSIVLEKLGSTTSALEGPPTAAVAVAASANVRAVGVDARFTVLQELLGDPLRFVDHGQLNLCKNK